MAYYHARANVCRAGVTRAGLAHHPFVMTLGGVDRTSSLLLDQFAVTYALNGQPWSSCAFSVQGFTPTVGETLLLTMGGEVIFGGTLTECKAVAQKFVSGAVFWHCQANDWTWLMDRYQRVFLDLPAGVSVNTAIRLVLAFTDPASGFHGGYMPSSLGTIGAISVQGDTVSQAIRRIVAAGNAYSRLRANKAVDAFQSLPASNALSLGNSSAIRNVVYEQSFSQIRTRSYYAGGGGTTTALVASGATSVPVDECGWYSGTQALAGTDVIGYTGRSAASGPGSLTGVTGVDRDIPQGTQIAVLSEANALGAQVDLAALLGGGQSGIAAGWFSDSRLSQAEVDGRANTDVNAFKAAVPSFGYTTSARWHEVGKTVAVSTTDPLTISATFRIQHVIMRPRGAVVGNVPSFEYQVGCRVFRRADLLD